MPDRPTTLFDIDRKPVTLDISFADLLGKGSAAIPEPERRERWAAWLAMASEFGRAYWSDTIACRGCRHLDGHWCKLQGLPATVNPILSFRRGIMGMACMGAGWEGADGNRRDDGDAKPPSVTPPSARP